MKRRIRRKTKKDRNDSEKDRERGGQQIRKDEKSCEEKKQRKAETSE